MKRYLTAILILFLLPQCKKTNTTNNYITTNNMDAVAVEGLTSVEIRKGLAANLPLVISYNASTQQKVTLSVTGLPDGITSVFYGPAIGYPTFGTSLTLYDTSTSAPTIAGDYHAIFTITGETGYRRQLPFTISVLDYDDSLCAAWLTGIYTACKIDTTHFSDTATADASISNKLWFSNFANRHIRINAIYDCDNRSFTIPTQIAGTDTISGTGNLITLPYGGYNFALYPIINGMAYSIYFNLR